MLKREDAGGGLKMQLSSAKPLLLVITSVLLIFFVGGCKRKDAKIIYLEKGQSAPYNGYLIDEQTFEKLGEKIILQGIK